jgi:hypothetical protein
MKLFVAFLFREQSGNTGTRSLVMDYKNDITSQQDLHDLQCVIMAGYNYLQVTVLTFKRLKSSAHSTNHVNNTRRS